MSSLPCTRTPLVAVALAVAVSALGGSSSSSAFAAAASGGCSAIQIVTRYSTAPAYAKPVHEAGTSGNPLTPDVADSPAAEVFTLPDYALGCPASDEER
jgi:TRAP-type uncharacterized transport system fused permease subunit